MPLDAILLSALTEELSLSICDMRVDRITQPEKDVFIFALRKPGKSVRLLLSAGVGSARVHLTELPSENPQTPPMFCMLLRKHLTGARIMGINQPHLERVIELEFAASDEIGTSGCKRIIVEMIGKRSNLILCGRDGRIIDCLRKVDAEMSEARQVLPGMFYRLPPPQNKLEPFAVTEEEFALLLEDTPREMKLESWLLNTFTALSPLICREIAHSVAGREDIRISESENQDIATAFFTFKEFVLGRKMQPFMLLKGDELFDITFLPVKQYKGAVTAERYGSFSELLDSYYTLREKRERTRQRSQSLLKNIKNLRDRTARKLTIRKEELKATYDREKYRQMGDIIKANLHNMQRGMTVLKAVNFYSENQREIEIKLDPKLGPSQNAERYYKLYSKAKNAETILKEQIKTAEMELDYLESVLEEISRAGGERDLDEIRQELVSAGYLKEKRNSKKTKPQKSPPMRFVSSSGTEILVGKNNLQNDALTLKIAGKEEIWLHAQKIHGSHVIIRSREPDDNTLLEGAMLAAYFSKARDGKNVPVDYTKVKHVKKTPRAKPGMVIYTNYKTLFVTPEEEQVKSLQSSHRGVFL
jgi:predicted ribosome quality control (RQC) complex YloA/Tae2 family protein